MSAPAELPRKQRGERRGEGRGLEGPGRKPDEQGGTEVCSSAGCGGSFATYYFKGSVAVNTVPSACVLATDRLPPCSSAMARAMASPRPCPPAPPVRALSAR